MTERSFAFAWLQAQWQWLKDCIHNWPIVGCAKRERGRK